MTVRHMPYPAALPTQHRALIVFRVNLRLAFRRTAAATQSILSSRANTALPLSLKGTIIVINKPGSNKSAEATQTAADEDQRKCTRVGGGG